MKRKAIIIVGMIVLLVGGYYLSNRPKGLKPLPTKDNPSPSGFYTEVPLFKQWVWVEEKDKEGNIVYRIRIPGADGFVEKIDSTSFSNRISIIPIERDCPSYICTDLVNSDSKNINEFYLDSEKFFNRKWFEIVGDGNLGKYRTLHGRYYFSDVSQDWHYILTSTHLILVDFDNDHECSGISKTVRTNHPKYYQECLDYMKIYLPIVEKALSTLEIPNYIDDRGFAPEEDWPIKLLPDESRIYEVR